MPIAPTSPEHLRYREVGPATMPAEAEAFPDPGGHLMERVAGTPDRTWFYWSGRESVRALENALSAAGRSLDSFDSILDFGCGCGRMLLWMEETGRRASLHGTDIDPEAITWAREQIPYATFAVNDSDPPLPYDDGAFDLVFNHSVFTHIDAIHQDMWLSELRRVTKPGGLVLLTCSSEHAMPSDAVDLRSRVEDEGIVFIEAGHEKIGLPEWYQAAFHAPWYVFEHWGRWFDILAYLPGAALGHQDHVLLRRPPGNAMLTPLESHPRSVPMVEIATSTPAPIHRSTSRYGPLADVARRFATRLIYPHLAAQARVNDGTANSLARLSQSVDGQAKRLSELESHVRTVGAKRAR